MGDEELGGNRQPRQLAVRCGARFPTAEVNGEMRLPHGSDWPSIREAGMKSGSTPSLKEVS